MHTVFPQLEQAKTKKLLETTLLLQGSGFGCQAGNTSSSTKKESHIGFVLCKNMVLFTEPTVDV